MFNELTKDLFIVLLCVELTKDLYIVHLCVELTKDLLIVHLCAELTKDLFIVHLSLQLGGCIFPVSCPLVHGERGSLSVSFATVIAVVGLGVSVNNMVFVEGGVFCESLTTALHCTHIGLLSCPKKCYNYIIPQ